DRGRPCAPALHRHRARRRVHLQLPRRDDPLALQRKPGACVRNPGASPGNYPVTPQYDDAGWTNERRGTEMSLHNPQVEGHDRFWQRIAFLAPGLAVSLFSIVLVSGCAGLPADDARAQIKPAGQYAADRALSGQSAQWPADNWWIVYGDAQLDHLIDEALAGA